MVQRGGGRRSASAGMSFSFTVTEGSPRNGGPQVPSCPGTRRFGGEENVCGREDRVTLRDEHVTGT